MGKNDRKQRKKKERQERLRKEKHLRHYGPGSQEEEFEEDFEYGPPDPATGLPPETILERTLRGKKELLGGLLSWLPGSRQGSTAQDRAQELAFDAIEERDPGRAAELARQALALDPECCDAYYVLAMNAAGSRQEQIRLLQQAVASAERRLGAPYFEENRGHFWGILETRPYMRARSALADILRGEGRLTEAIGHYEALLDLNPNDNQGIRQVLLGCYFMDDNLEGVRRLFQQYAEDWGAIFSYSRVLERFLAGDLEEAARLRQEAHKENRHVESYLTERKKLPRHQPEWYSPGDDNEAVYCALYLTDAWKRHPKALAWLKSQRA